LAASGVAKRRRRRMERALGCDKLLSDAQDEELAPEADMDELLLIEQAAAIADALRDRELAARSEALQRLVEESPVTAQSPSIARRSAHRPNPAARIVVAGSRFESAVARGEQRATRQHEAHQRGHRAAAVLSNPTALVAWCLLAIVTWWALPKNWSELAVDAERGTRTARVSSPEAGALHVTPVAATPQRARDALRQRALTDPLSVQAYKPIEEIRPGDLVLARDDEGETLVARTVTQRFERRSDHLRTVTYLAADGEERALETTDEHPFWVHDRGWTPAKNLSPGDEFQQSNGETAILIETEFDAKLAGVAVYNFEVAGAHNYFVADPNTIRGPPGLASIDATLAEIGLGDAVLVHDTCRPGWNAVNESMSARSRLYQAQITGKAGMAYVVKGVKFDGVRRGVLLEAKGLGYRNFIKDGEFRSWFTSGRNALLNQAQNQIRAAGGKRIEWHVAEQEFADVLRKTFSDNGIGIGIVFTPFSR